MAAIWAMTRMDSESNVFCCKVNPKISVKSLIEASTARAERTAAVKVSAPWIIFKFLDNAAVISKKPFRKLKLPNKN